MGTISKLCGLAGFLGLFGILTASCVTTEAPTGSSDSDGTLGIGAAALLHATCNVICKDGTKFWSVEFAGHNQEELNYRANNGAEQMCANRGGLHLRDICANWTD